MADQTEKALTWRWMICPGNKKGGEDVPSRIIKESITTSESLSGISAEAERLFWRLVVKADDYGIYYGNPKILASVCFPIKPPKEQKIHMWLQELERAGMVGIYTAEEDGKRYIKLLSWDKHQQKRAKKSKFPVPKAFDNNGNQVIANVPVNEKRETRNEKREACLNGAKKNTHDFDVFWEAYPRKVGKQDALKAWEQIHPDGEVAKQIIDGVERWKSCEQWTKDGGQFICYPGTFIRQRRWEEYDQPMVKTSLQSNTRDYDSDDDFFDGR